MYIMQVRIYFVVTRVFLHITTIHVLRWSAFFTHASTKIDNSGMMIKVNIH